MRLLLPSAVLEKEHKDKDEKMNKIKAVAIKAKKELDISKKEVERDVNVKFDILTGIYILQWLNNQQEKRKLTIKL